MSNHLKVLILSLLILLILFTIYILLRIPSENAPISIAPINIKTEKNLPKITLLQKPSDILLKLKLATEASQITIFPQKKVKNEIIEEIINPKEEVMSVKKEITNVKKEIISLKKEMTKKVVTIKKKKKKKKKKKILARKKPIKVKIAHKKTKSSYYKAEKTFPDTYYFEPSKAEKNVKENTPLKFVKTLGVVNVSNNYESTFTIPQKVELAKEGIVNISTESIETANLKELEFVDTLGVIEVSTEFETIDTQNY